MLKAVLSRVNPACLLKMLAKLEMTFSPDGGAGAKVREQLKSSGTVLRDREYPL